MARDGSVVWFHCDARMVRHPDGSPWFIHGVAFDAAANERMMDLNGGTRNVPVLVENGKVIQVGWQGRSCVAGPATEVEICVC